MKKYKFSDLLIYEEKTKKLFAKYDSVFNPVNRIAKYFQYLRKIEEMRRLDIQRFRELFSLDKTKYYYSQYYVLEMCNLINSLEKKPQDRIILQHKLSNLTKGTYLLSEENPSDTKARDTTFELSLFSFLQSKGLDITICEPNPDLKLKSKKFTYEIECKRPQSIKSLEKCIKKATEQLDKTNGLNIIPTIAISLDLILFEWKDLILDSRDESSASEFLNTTLETFLRDNLKMIRKIVNNKSCLLLYYLSCLVGFKSDTPMANATFITGNIYNFENNLSNLIYEDLSKAVTGAHDK